MTPILIAAGLGALVGLERQVHQGLAGLRTNALVATAAAAFVHLPQAARTADVHPASLAAAVISGIGFLGAGVILRDGMNVRGLNTAATLWCSAAIGTYAGAGLGIDATGLAAIILAINILLRPLLSRLNRLTAYFSVGAPIRFAARVETTAARVDEIRAAIVVAVRHAGLHLRSLGTSIAMDHPDQSVVDFELFGFGRVELTMERLMAGLGERGGIIAFSWARTDPAGTDPTIHPAS